MIPFTEDAPAAPAPTLEAISDDVCRSLFAERERLTVSEWSDAHRRLSTESSAEAGRFDTDRVPYLRWVQDLLGNETVREIVCAKSAQVGFSTAVSENFVGYTMDHDPSGFLVLWPTEKMLRNWSTKRLAPMIRDSERLSALFPESGRRSSKDSVASKLFPGGYLAGLSAKSSADVRSFSARRGVAEEIDEYPTNLNRQGDTIDLFRRRLSTFWNGKLVLNSTPTIKGYSRVWKELEESTWHRFHVPCPVCHHQQTLRWRDEDEYGDPAGETPRLLFERDAGGQLIPGSCRYVCESCDAEISERFKLQMLREGAAAQGAGGGWIARFPERWPHKVGVHINTLYSPLIGWDEIARAFLRSQKEPDQLQVFVNTMLGLPYEETSDRLNGNVLASRAIAYAENTDGELLVPRGVGLLTAFVDVQGDRLELFVWGWGDAERAWVVAWEQIFGDPGVAATWAQLDERLLRWWPHEDGAALKVACTLIDAGYQTETVWRFCEARADRRVVATVGRDGRGRKLIEAPTPDRLRRHGAKKKRPMHVIGTDTAKDMLASRLKIADREKPHAITFHTRLDRAYFEQLTNERLMTRYRNGRPVRVWWLPPGLANEALDGAVGNLAALGYLGLPVINRLGELAEAITKKGRDSGGGATAAPPAASSGGGWTILSKGIE